MLSKQFVAFGLALFYSTLLPSQFLLAQSTQKPIRAMEAYEYANQKRTEAEKLWGQKDAKSEDIEKGIKILEDVLIFLDDPYVMELGRGNIYLRYRRLNVFFELATAHSLLGHKSEAIDYLRKTFAEGSSGNLLKEIEETKAFDNLRQEEGYKEVIKKFRTVGTLWNSPALKTPYQNNISDEEKIAGLSLLWSQVKYNFAYFDHVPGLDWDRLYLTYLPKAQQTKSTLEYYAVLRELCALLKDGHTNVYPPKEIQDQIYSRPPLFTALIEDKILIVDVYSESLRQTGIRPGLEVLSIDSIPVHEYGEQRVAPYQSSSTKQDLNVRTYSYALLAGAKDKPVELELSDETGKIFKKSVARGGYADVKSRPGFEFKVLSNNVAYVELRSFGDSSAVKFFDEKFEAISKTDALILDLRANGGGSSSVGYEILGYLNDQPFKGSAWKTRDYRAAYVARGVGEYTWDGEPAGDYQPNGKKLYAKPVVVLTSAQTFSAAEDFCVAFDYMKRGKIIGEPTGGSTGQPLTFSLPGGGSARVCTKRDTYPDGREFVGIGIKPDVIVKPTIADLRAGKDRVLDTALGYLQDTLKKR